ncbi:protein outspread isoform X1 [Tribolium madens]|uniref:protein outspread isoform X1 n=1 Tax=Tribolium madens TaxID=41895 RepID=UPI001CF734BF|nr:protein outspread isoform X1 [Tribolium madens]
MSQCKKFAPNIFHKTKCSNCFRQKEEHSAEALECNRASRSIARSGYLFVAPDWDFSVPLNRTKRWQRRWFVLYDDGELNYSVDEHPDTIPQGSVDMSKVLEVTGAEQVTGHPHSLALTSPDRVTFVKAASREDARWWAELLAVFPRRHKRNATFPGGRASPSLPQLGRSASPQPPRPRHLSCSGPSPRTNFETPPLKEERESPPKEEPRPGWLPEPTGNVTIETVPSPIRNDYLISSGSPPTRDKLRCDDKARARRDWRNERLRDIATALTDRSPESSLALPAESLLHLKKGWLWLKTIEGDFVMRWAVLFGPTLNVYQDQDEQNPEIVVEMSSVSSFNEIPTETKFGFEIKWAGPTLVLYAVTSGIRSNWLQALKKAVPASSSESPTTPRSVLLSSDEEYRTASEGGRRGSEDWGELPPSPPLTRSSLNRVKTTRIRPRLPRCQSRQSTLDSTSTDELDCMKLPDTVELNNEINKQNVEINDLQKQLAKSVEEVRSLEEEIARLKKLQAEAMIQEMKFKEMALAFERTERELNQRNSQAELKFTKEQRSLQRKLAESEDLAASYEEKCSNLSRELQTKQRILGNLQEELSSTNERFGRLRDENDRLFKRVQELEGRGGHKRGIRCDSLTDLTNIDLDVDIDELGQNELKEYCLDLRGRFEKAVLEIRAVKRELRDAHEKCDNLELMNYSIQNNLEMVKQESQAEIGLLVSRLEHLTQKLNAAEKQIRTKSKSESRDKRRSLSLKGRESFSINKEVEEKVAELEEKILALERGRTKRKYKRDRSSERNSPIDDKSLRRLRRKSLDSATSSEPMKLLMRLSTLESQVTNVNASTESLNVALAVSDSPVKTKIDECLNQVALLKTMVKRSHSLSALEQNLTELNEIVDADSITTNVTSAEINVINSSASAVVKQLHTLLVEKLKNLSERKRSLRESNKLDSDSKLEILAEKVAYENILIGRIQEALTSPATGEVTCERLVNKEVRETAHLMNSLSKKLNGGSKQMPTCKTSADYLTKILAKCLMTAAGGASGCKNFVSSCAPSMEFLRTEQKKLGAMLDSYKAAKLPVLAEILAGETLSVDKNCRLKKLSDDVVSEFTKGAKDVANSELIQSEINHVLLRAAQIYQGHIDADHPYFFTFFASERAALELWSDSVGDCLYEEVNKSVSELTELYLNQLNKLQRQNWRRRLESERSRSSSALLQEFADVVAHKALIDARMDVLSGKCSTLAQLSAKESLGNWLQNDNLWDCLENQSVQINQSVEAEFMCMIDRCSKDCYALVGQPELEEVLGYLNDLADEIGELQKQANLPVEYDEVVVRNWGDVCAKCRSLRDKLEEVRKSIERTSKGITRTPSFRRLESFEEHRPVYLGTEYLTQVENLRAAYRCALASCKERHQESDIEQLQILCERVLLAMEQWHRRTIQELRETHAQETERLRQEKEQALAEETQATLAALDAMKKAHEAEVQREVAKFKQEYARQQRHDLLDLSERLSVKCLEAAALEEQLGSATRQLTQAQQHILQLERNPQLSPMQVE